MTSGVNTSPSSRKAWSFSSAVRTSPSEPGVFLIPFLASPSSSYRSASIGDGGSILFLIPSSPAISSAEKARYGLHDGSGARNSMRFDFGLDEYIGMRQIADRMRCEVMIFL